MPILRLEDLKEREIFVLGVVFKLSGWLNHTDKPSPVQMSKVYKHYLENIGKVSIGTIHRYLGILCEKGYVCREGRSKGGRLYRIDTVTYDILQAKTKQEGICL